MLLFILLINLVFASPINVHIAEVSSSPTQFAEWHLQPDIKVCTHAPIDFMQLNNAITWWKKRGYSFGVVIQSNCIETTHYGFIVIDLIGQGFDLQKSLATTKLHYNLKNKKNKLGLHLFSKPCSNKNSRARIWACTRMAPLAKTKAYNVSNMARRGLG